METQPSFILRGFLNFIGFIVGVLAIVYTSQSTLATKEGTTVAKENIDVSKEGIAVTKESIAATRESIVAAKANEDQESLKRKIAELTMQVDSIKSSSSTNVSENQYNFPNKSQDQDNSNFEENLPNRKGVLSDVLNPGIFPKKTERKEVLSNKKPSSRIAIDGNGVMYDNGVPIRFYKDKGVLSDVLNEEILDESDRVPTWYLSGGQEFFNSKRLTLKQLTEKYGNQNITNSRAVSRRARN